MQTTDQLKTINDTQNGDELILDGYEKRFTVLKPLYEPTGHSQIGVKAIDDDFNKYELRLVNNEFLDVRPESDNSPVRMMSHAKRCQDFEVVGHSIERVEEYLKQLWN